MGKTHSKPLAAQHGRGMAWARHAMCESAFMPPLAAYTYCETATTKQSLSKKEAVFTHNLIRDSVHIEKLFPVK
jgi:hypothetical protein